MKKLLFTILILTLASCNYNDFEDLQNQINKLQKQIDNQKELIYEYSQETSIKRIEEVETGFIIYFSNNTSLELKNGLNGEDGINQNSIISIIRDGNFFKFIFSDNSEILVPITIETKIYVGGDSMVKGHSLPNNEIWTYYLEVEKGWTIINGGINGNYLTSFDKGNEDYRGRGTPLVDRFENEISDDVTHIIYFIGTNDIAAWDGSPSIGSFDHLDIETNENRAEISSAFNYMLSRTKALHPTKKIGVITPFLRPNSNESRNREVVDLMVAICARNNVKVYNNVIDYIITLANPNDASNLGLGDSYHWNKYGMQIEAQKYGVFIENL